MYFLSSEYTSKLKVELSNLIKFESIFAPSYFRASYFISPRVESVENHGLKAIIDFSSPM